MGVAEKKPGSAAVLSRKLQTPGCSEIGAIEYCHHRAYLGTAKCFHDGPRKILTAPHGNNQTLVEPDAVRKKTGRVQRPIRSYIDDVAVLPGNTRCQYGGEGQSAR